MTKTAGALNVLELVDRAKQRGWLIGYRRALLDLERLAESRGDDADIGELIASLRGDAEAIEREASDYAERQPRQKLAADRLKTIASLRRQGHSLAEIAKRLGVSKSRAGQLIAEAGDGVQKSSSTGRKLDDADQAAGMTRGDG
jgi:DNA-directed RNA polymerase specialized sigma subunit